MDKSGRDDIDTDYPPIFTTNNFVYRHSIVLKSSINKLQKYHIVFSINVTLDVATHLVEHVHVPHISKADSNINGSREENEFYMHNTLMHSSSEEHAFSASSEDQSSNVDPMFDTNASLGSPSTSDGEISGFTNALEVAEAIKLPISLEADKGTQSYSRGSQSQGVCKASQTTPVAENKAIYASCEVKVRGNARRQPPPIGSNACHKRLVR